MKVEIVNNKLLVEGKHIPFISGEVHYWRMNPIYWDKILDRVKELGLNIIASYIPWEFHEYSEDKFDFNGHTNPQRDLAKFLELVKIKGLYLIIRPGPYIYSEWKNAGVTDKSAKYHRLHPEAIKLSKSYIKEVSNIIQPFLISNGGCIIGCQADNEIDPFITSFEFQLGFDGTGGLFSEYIQEKYESIEELNKSWNSQYHDFKEVKGFLENRIENKYFWKRNKDSIKFIHWYVEKYAKWCIDEFKNNGIDVPFILNGYPWFETHDYKKLQTLVPLVGVDIYPANEYSARDGEHQSFYEILKVITSLTDFPFIMEFEAGIWHGFHYSTGILKSNHYRLSALTALMAGIKGWNWYMIVDRDNWYMSPINPKGMLRKELAGTFKNIIEIFKKINPSDMQKVTNIGLVIDNQQLNDFGTKNILRDIFYQTNLDYEMYDIRGNHDKKEILFYPGPDWLFSESQNKLLKYVEEGGILVLFQNYPRLDENLNEFNIFDIPLPDRITMKEDPNFPLRKFQINLGNKKASAWGSTFIYDDPPGEPIIAKEIANDNKGSEENDFLFTQPPNINHNIGFIKNIKKGKLVVLGVLPNSEIILSILEHFNIRVSIRANVESIQSSIFRNGDKYYVIVTNNGNEEKNVEIQLTDIQFSSNLKKVIDLVTGCECSYITKNESTSIICNIPRKDGTILELEK
jgi:beta-galactosidase GanA